jgi:hypothetical protein
MGNTAWVEVQLALTGCLRLARGDRGGLSCFDRSLDGFWRSFRAAVISYPLYLVLLAMRVSTAEWQNSGGSRIVLVETIGYVVAWVAFPLLMLTVTRWLGRAHRFFDFMVPYNWCQVPQSALFVLAGLVSGILSTQASEAIDIVAALATLVYEWFIARVALDTTGLVAVFVVLLDLVLGVLISRVTGWLYGVDGCLSRFLREKPGKKPLSGAKSIVKSPKNLYCSATYPVHWQFGEPGIHALRSGNQIG